jgi:hypothetical protein
MIKQQRMESWELYTIRRKGDKKIEKLEKLLFVLRKYKPYNYERE